VRSSHAISTTREISLSVRPGPAAADAGFSGLMLVAMGIPLKGLLFVRFGGFIR